MLSYMYMYYFVDDSDEDRPPPTPAPRSPLLRSNTAAKQDRHITTRTDKVVVYWVSYLDRQQRVLLLTQDERIAKRAKKVDPTQTCQTIDLII